MSVDDGSDGAGGASSTGYEGGTRGAGNAPPSRPAEKTDDRCFKEGVKAALSVRKLVNGFDVLNATTAALDVASFVTCVADRIANPPK
jgi:hypothetical protein